MEFFQRGSEPELYLLGVALGDFGEVVVEVGIEEAIEGTGGKAFRVINLSDQGGNDLGEEQLPEPRPDGGVFYSLPDRGETQRESFGH